MMPSESTRGSHKILPLIPVATEVRDGEDAASPIEIRPSTRVIIEIVGICQAKCPYCAQNSGKSRRQEKPKAYMPVEMFGKIVSRLAKSEAFTTRKIDRVYLYNWGEPFLAPAFNEYLEILKAHRLYAVVSSNFQSVPVVRPDLLPVINEVLFSLSGMTQDTYGRIHGGDIKKVLANFERFASEMQRYSPSSKIFMAWHRYRFNEHEFWTAYGYSRKHGIKFLPTIAFLNDLTELIQAGKGRLPKERRENAQRDLYFEHMVNTIGTYSKAGNTYDCPAYDDLVIDEQGRLLICCGTDSQTSLGNVFEVPFEELRARKIRSGFCATCRDTGVAEWAHNNHHDRNQLPWPAGGGVDYVRLKYTFNKHKVRNDVRLFLNSLSVGDAVLNVYRKLKYS